MSGDIERANPRTGEIVRQDFAGTQIERARETATAAMTAQATAEVQAMYIVARQYPRSWLDVRARLLDDCKRPGFAESALYEKPQRMRNEGERKDLPIGEYYDGFLEGLSIRFAEAAHRTAGNIRAGSMAIYDDDEKRTIVVYATDLEANSRLDSTVTIDKTVERKSAKGRIVVADRLNGSGDRVYLLEATEDELRTKQNANISREKRNLVLALIPADIREECEAQVRATRKAKIAADPDAEAKRLADGFAALRIMPSDLAAYLGHELSQCTPAELERLRGLYVALKEGAVTWLEIAEERDKPEKERPKTSKAKQFAEALLKAKRAAEEKAKAASPPTSEQTKADAKATPKKGREPGEEA